MMMVVFILFIIILFIGAKINLKDNNDEYMSKKQTTIINGFFVILVFFSHFLSYVNEIDQIDSYLRIIISHIGQLMVTTFLFYSGYGIYESIKNNQKYKNNFFKKRFIPTFINFVIAIIAFILVNLLMGNEFNLRKTLLSFIGWESIGNSNWYMFVIFSEYIFLMISYKLFKKDKYQLLFVSASSILYIFIMSLFKESYWYDTIMCFPIGMYFSYFKDNIEKYILNKKKYWLILNLVIFLFIILFMVRYKHVLIYNIFSLVFVILIILGSIKIKFNSILFEDIGKRVFWIYILQRIPMMVFNGMFNYKIYFIICLVCTIFLAEIFYRITNILNKKYFKKI